MNPTQFAGSNKILRAAPGTEHYVQDLPVVQCPGFVASCWRMDLGDRLRAALCGRVWLLIEGHTHAPVRLQTERPIPRRRLPVLLRQSLLSPRECRWNRCVRAVITAIERLAFWWNS